MNWDLLLRQLPNELRLLLLLFLLAMLFGYGASFAILADQTGLSAQGIEENYNGNEDDEAAETIKFRKSKFEMLTSVHSHVFTLSLIFLTTGIMAFFTGLPKRIKLFLIAEPLISLITSFGSLILLWAGFPLFNYIALFSGTLMHATFIITIILLIRELCFLKTSSF